MPGKREAWTLMALKFAEFYCRTGKKWQSVISAGYNCTPAAAAVQATRLLKRKEVQDYIASRRIDRTVHAEQTYQEICELKDMAMANARAALGLNHDGSKPDKMIPCDSEEVSRAIAVASKHLELMAKVDGLLLEKPPDDGTRAEMVRTLQELVKQIPKYTPSVVIDAPAAAALPAPKNGDTWHSIDEAPTNGNGH